MQWLTHGERYVYESPWVSVALVDVEVPGVRRYEHHVIRSYDASATLVHDPDRGVLLVWRHRFIADRWGWEIPGGIIDTGETPAQAAARECGEESGWIPNVVTLLGSYQPIAGSSAQTFHMFLGSDPIAVDGWDGSDETERVEWVSVDRMKNELRRGGFVDGLSITTCAYALAFGLLGDRPPA